MKSDLSKLKAVLADLRERSDDVLSSALLTEDGIMLAADIANKNAEDRLAAMSAAVLSIGGRMSSDILNDATERVMIKSKAGYLVVTQVAQEMLLAVIAKSDAKLGMVFHDIEKVAKQLAT